MRCCLLVACVLTVLVANVVASRHHRRGRKEWTANRKEHWYNEGRIINKLLHQSFSQRTYPAINDTVPVTIRHGLSLIAITQVTTKDRYPFVTFRAQVQQVWGDPRLMWASQDVGNITHIHMQSNYIWTPETEVFPNMDDVDYLSDDKHDVIVTSPGEVTWTYIATYRVPCSGIRNEKYVMCSFRTWLPMYNAKEVDIVPLHNTVKLTDYVTVGANAVRESSVKRDVARQSDVVHSALRYEFTFETSQEW